MGESQHISLFDSSSPSFRFREHDRYISRSESFREERNDSNARYVGNINGDQGLVEEAYDLIDTLKKPSWNKAAAEAALALFRMIDKPIVWPYLNRRFHSEEEKVRQRIIGEMWRFYSTDAVTNRRKTRFNRKDSKILLEWLWVDIKQEQVGRQLLSRFSDEQIFEADRYFLQIINETIMGSEKWRYSFIRSGRMIDKCHVAAYFDCYFQGAVGHKEKLMRKWRMEQMPIQQEDNFRTKKKAFQTHRTVDLQNLQNKKHQIKRLQPEISLDEYFKWQRSRPRPPKP